MFAPRYIIRVKVGGYYEVVIGSIFDGGVMAWLV